jgi:ligand-binding sensor domain-containing protein/two-component sensor histidine kinase
LLFGIFAIHVELAMGIRSGKGRIAVTRLVVRLFLTLLGATIAHAERLPIKIYTSADGLGSSATFNLVRDSRGFIWICSRDGLIRFDGYRFITYRMGNEDADPAVYDLLPTRNSGYWINLNRGTDYHFTSRSDATLLEPISKQLAKHDPRVQLSAEPITDTRLPLFEDSAGNLWAADYQGIYLMREVDGRMVSQLIELKLPGSDLTNVRFNQGRDGSLWIATDWGLVRRLPDGRVIHYTLRPGNDHDPVSLVAEDNDGRVWIARPEGLLVLRVEPLSELTGLGDFTVRKVIIKKGSVNRQGQALLIDQTNEASAFTFADILRRDYGGKSNPETTPKPVINGLLSASDGELWITSNRGLVVFDGKRFQHFTTQEGLGSNSLTSMVEDNEGRLWIASLGGLHRLNPRGLVSFGPTDGLEPATVHSIYEDRNGELLVVSGNWKISRMHDGVFQTTRPHLPDEEIRFWRSNVAFLDSRGDWWILSNQKLYRYSGLSRLEDLASRRPSAVYGSSNGLVADSAYRLSEDSRGNIWISSYIDSTPMGLARWERSTGRFQRFLTKDGLPQDAVASAFAEDRAGNLWFGFIHGGISRYMNERFTTLAVTDGIPPGAITDLYSDSSGRLWIASSVGGLTRVDDPTIEHPAFRHYTTADGLTSNNVRCITEDLFGNIYVGTVRGVNRLSPETGNIKYYGTGDGLASDFVNVAYRDRNGALWFGTFNGLSKLIPQPDPPSQPPPILISGLRVAGEDYSVSPLGQTQVFVPEQSASRNNLQIDFFSISGGGDDSTRYQYKLEGTDSDWSPLTAERAIAFANLSPGAYGILVRAVNAEGVASQRPASVSFTILRPFWQRWWFLTGAACLFGLAAIALYRYRVGRLIELERVRTRLASDLHDDIGSSLSQVSVLSEVIRRRLGSDPSVSEPLSMIARLSSDLVDSMSDIVWAVNPQRDHLADLTHRMRRLASDVFTAKEIDFAFKAPDDQHDMKMGADVRREVFLIFKESLNNTVRHSACSRAEIHLRVTGDLLELAISDDGIGFDADKVRDGNGLSSMRQRAQRLGGSVEIRSSQGRGSTIMLKVPVGRRAGRTRSRR